MIPVDFHNPLALKWKADEKKKFLKFFKKIKILSCLLLYI